MVKEEQGCAWRIILLASYLGSLFPLFYGLLHLKRIKRTPLSSSGTSHWTLNTIIISFGREMEIHCWKLSHINLHHLLCGWKKVAHFLNVSITAEHLSACNIKRGAKIVGVYIQYRPCIKRALNFFPAQPTLHYFLKRLKMARVGFINEHNLS